jgi:hypothetical protein
MPHVAALLSVPLAIYSRIPCTTFSRWAKACQNDKFCMPHTIVVSQMTLKYVELLFASFVQPNSSTFVLKKVIVKARPQAIGTCFATRVRRERE